MTGVAFKRGAAWTALGSLAFLVANLVTWLAVAGFDIGRAIDPVTFVTLSHRTALIRTSLAFDTAAYMLLVPLIAHLWSRFDAAEPGRSRMYAAGGLAYSLAGATGAVVLLFAWPPLITLYAHAHADRATVLAVFDAFTKIVYKGMWNVVGAAGIGTWLLGNGALMAAAERPYGRLGVAAGAAGLLDAALNLAGAEVPAMIALLALGTLAPVWIGLVAFDLLRE